MQNRAGTIFLFVVVLAIWGIIAFKIYDYIKGGNAEAGSGRLPDKSEQGETFIVDSFALLPDYRDPFLGYENPVKRKIVPVPVNIHKPLDVPPVKAMQWPPVLYKGLVYNEDTKTKAGLVNISGKSKMVSEGDTFKLLVVVSVTRDSILLKMQKNKRAFYKK